MEFFENWKGLSEEKNVINIDDIYTDELLHDNIRDGNLEYIVKYLSDGGNPSRIIIDEFSLLMCAVYFNQSSIVNILLMHGAYTESKNSRGETALDYATKFEKVSVYILTLLLDNNANFNNISNDGYRTTLQQCIDSSLTHSDNLKKDTQYIKLRLLLEYGADPNYKNELNQDALHYAVDELEYPISVEILKLFIIYGGNINSLNWDNDSLLFRARIHGYKDIDTILFLLDWGANPYLKNKMGIDIFNLNYFGDKGRGLSNNDINEAINKKIEELHKTNVAYQMLNIAKGIEENPLEELSDDLLEKTYQKLLDEPYNSNLTLERKMEDLNDLEIYGKYVKRTHLSGGGVMDKVCIKCKKLNDCSGTCGLYCDHCKGKTMKKKYKSKLVDYQSENNPYLSYDDRNKNLYKKSMKTKSKLYAQRYRKSLKDKTKKEKQMYQHIRDEVLKPKIYEEEEDDVEDLY